MPLENSIDNIAVKFTASVLLASSILYSSISVAQDAQTQTPAPAASSAQAPAAARAVVAVVETEQVEAIVRKKAMGARQRVDFIKIEEEREDGVAQPMRSRPQALMHDPAFIKGGRMRGRLI